MTIERLNPEGLSTPAAYSHVVRARGGSTIYLAGQTPIDAAGNVVGEGDFAAQARQVYGTFFAPSRPSAPMPATSCGPPPTS